MSSLFWRLLIFTDVDGCLLNKADYRYDAALPALERLRQLQIPLILCSSKTAAELSELHRELALKENPFVAENGGVIVRPANEGSDTSATVITGAPRAEILTRLEMLRQQFRFRTFSDLGIEGVMQTTDLSQAAACRALDRQTTEPLLWDDEPQRIAAFTHQLAAAGLTLTRGGRFWHVAGPVTKGSAMQQIVADHETSTRERPVIAAIGDSPIDQSMLDDADYPIGIPAPDGSLHVTLPGNRGFAAPAPGAAGWAAAVNRLLDQLTNQQARFD